MSTSTSFYFTVYFAFYLSLYAMYKMVGCVQNELNSMRDGLHDVVPLELLSGLAAEVGVPTNNASHQELLCTLG